MVMKVVGFPQQGAPQAQPSGLTTSPPATGTPHPRRAQCPRPPTRPTLPRPPASLLSLQVPAQRVHLVFALKERTPPRGNAPTSLLNAGSFQIFHSFCSFPQTLASRLGAARGAEGARPLGICPPRGRASGSGRDSCPVGPPSPAGGLAHGRTVRGRKRCLCHPPPQRPPASPGHSWTGQDALELGWAGVSGEWGLRWGFFPSCCCFLGPSGPTSSRVCPSPREGGGRRQKGLRLSPPWTLGSHAWSEPPCLQVKVYP